MFSLEVYGPKKWEQKEELNFKPPGVDASIFVMIYSL
jgi:hypothetical protein